MSALSLPKAGVSSAMAELCVPPLYQPPADGYIQLHFPLRNPGLDLAEGKNWILSQLCLFHPFHPCSAEHTAMSWLCNALTEGSPPNLMGKSWTIPVLYREKKVGHRVIHPAEVSLLLWEFGSRPEGEPALGMAEERWISVPGGMDLSPWRVGSQSLFPSAWVASLHSTGVSQDSSCKARELRRCTQVYSE